MTDLDDGGYAAGSEVTLSSNGALTFKRYNRNDWVNWSISNYNMVKTNEGIYTYTFEMPSYELRLFHDHNLVVEYSNDGDKLSAGCRDESASMKEIVKVTAVDNVYDPVAIFDTLGAMCYITSQNAPSGVDFTVGDVYFTKSNSDERFNTHFPVGDYYANVDVTIDGDVYTIYAPFKVTAKDITAQTGEAYDVAVTVDPLEKAYNAAAPDFNVTVTYNGVSLTKDTDYTVTVTPEDYKAQDYTIKVTGIGNYTGTLTFTYKINAADVSADITFNVKDKTYDAEAYDAGDYEITGSTTLANNLINANSSVTTKTVTYYSYDAAKEDNLGTQLNGAPTDAGHYVAKLDIVSSTGNYKPVTKYDDFTIEKAKIVPQLQNHTFTYGQLTYGTLDEKLHEGNNFQWNTLVPVTGDTITAKYSLAGAGEAAADPAIPVGTYTLNIELLGDKAANYTIDYEMEDYFGSKMVDRSLTVEKFDISRANVVANVEEFIYNGNKQVPEFTLSNIINQAQLAEETDYTVNYHKDTADGAAVADPTDAGTYVAVFEGKGNYTGTVTKTWKITAAELKEVNATPNPDTYTTLDLTPTVTVKGDPDNDRVYDVLATTEYDVAFYEYNSNSNESLSDLDEFVDSHNPITPKAVGTYLIVATGKHNYSGKVSVVYEVGKATANADHFDVTTNKIYDGEAVDKADFVVAANENATAAEREELTNGTLEIKTISYKQGDTALNTAPVNAGTYTATITFTGKNINEFTKTVQFTIARRPVTVTAENKESVYLFRLKPLTAVPSAFDADNNTGAVAADVDNPETVEGLDWETLVTANLGTIPGVGEYSIAAVNDIPAEFSNYDITIVPGKYTVTPYDLSADYTTVDPNASVELVLQASVAEDNFDDNVAYIFNYDGSKHGVEVYALVAYVDGGTGGARLALGTDYTLGGTSVALYAGDYQVMIEGKGNFTGKLYENWKIVEGLNDADVHDLGLDSSQYTLDVDYDGEDVTYDVHSGYYNTSEASLDSENDFHVFTGNINTRDADVSVIYKDNEGNEVPAPKTPGTYTVTVTVKDKEGNYGPDKTKTFTLKINNLQVELTPVLSVTSFTYGDAEPTVESFEENPFFAVDCDDETWAELEPQLAQCLTGGFVGNGVYGFTINEAQLNALIDLYPWLDYYNITVDDNVFAVYSPADLRDVEAETVKLALKADGFTTLKDGVKSLIFTKTGQQLVEGVDFEFIGDPNTNTAGTFIVQIEGKGNFTGTKKISVEVVDITLKIAAYQSFDDQGRINFVTDFGYITDSNWQYGMLTYRTDAEDILLSLDTEGVTNSLCDNTVTSFRMRDIGTYCYARPYIIREDGVIYGEQLKVRYDEVIAEEIAEGPHSEIIIIKKFDEEGRIQFCTNFVYKGDEPVQYGILTTRKPEFINKSLTLDIEGLTNTLADSVFYRFRMRDLGDGCVARTYMIIGEGENQQVLYGDQVVVYYAEL